MTSALPFAGSAGAPRDDEGAPQGRCPAHYFVIEPVRPGMIEVKGECRDCGTKRRWPADLGLKDRSDWTRPTQWRAFEG